MKDSGFVNLSLTIGGNLRTGEAGEKEKWSAMNGKIAWNYSARAFEASQNERLPRLLRRVLFRFGIAWFWTALALEGRALEVWRELRAQAAAARPRALALAWSHCVDRIKELIARRPKGQCQQVLAWSLPDSRQSRALGLGCMWAVLCPYCEDFHTHSPGEGRRTPHCCSDQDRDQYVLEFAGTLPIELRTPFYRSSQAGWPRLLRQWPEPSRGLIEAVQGTAALEAVELRAAA